MGLTLRNRVALSLAALLLLGAITAQVIAERDQGRGPALSSRDADGEGALGLALWLEEMGHRVSRVEAASSPTLSSTDVLLILRPVRHFSRPEAQGIVGWVREGGVLIYVPSPWPVTRDQPVAVTDSLAEEIALATDFGPRVAYAQAALPFFVSPAPRFRVNSFPSLALRDETWVPLVQGEGRVFAATRQLGGGRIHAAASEAFFSNRGIQEHDNAVYMLSVLAQQPPRRAIAFEEVHHSVFEAPDLAGVARASPWGWALAYFAAATFGFALWGGRRFGPPLVVDRPPARTTGEYVAAFAGLLQRARAIDWVQRHYAGLVRRRLARLLGVRADLPVSELAGRLADRRRVDPAPLVEHLGALEGARLGERDLLARVRAVERLLSEADRPTTETRRHGD